MKKLITGLVIGALSSSAFATTWTVDDDGKADFDNIQAAVDAATDGDEIIVMPGTYFENLNLSYKSLTLRSKDGPDSTIIDGGMKGTVVSIVGKGSTSISLEGFSVTNGTGTESNITGGQDHIGGGLLISGGTITIQNCRISNNYLLINTPSQGNYHVLGGGIFANNCVLTISDTNCNNNVCEGFNDQHDYTSSYAFGGGLFSLDSTLVIDNSFFWGNMAISTATGAWTSTNASGGAMCVLNGSATVSNCALYDNMVESNAVVGWGAGTPSLATGGGFAAIGSSEVTIQASSVTDNNIELTSGQTWYESGNSIAAGAGVCAGSLVSLAWLNGVPEVSIELSDVSGNVILVDTARGSNAQGAGIATVGNSPWIGTMPLIANTSIENNQIVNDGGLYDIGNGGGVYFMGGTNYIESCTVRDNESPTTGGAFYFEETNYTTIFDTTVCGNSLVQVVGDWVSEGENCFSFVCKEPDYNGFIEDCPCTGDIDESGIVNTIDVLLLLAVFGQSGESIGDINADGIVDVTDLLIVINNWGACY
ncbi:MAG: hypothetical protein HOC93_04860 [Phycisphaerae bacterium]|jgi:hypothetical protein|nr:hypothetical protein [Phycisphaerae bacterium]